MSGERSWNQGVPSLLLTNVNVLIFSIGRSVSPHHFIFYKKIVVKGPIHASFKVVNTTKESIISKVILIACKRVFHQ
jgi:hypothetical protein